MANQFKSIRKKTLLVSGTLVILWAALIARLFYIQVLNSKKYQELCSNQANLRKAILPRRGTFYDRNGKALTIDLISYSIAAHPYLVPDKARLASALANDLSAKPDRYLKLLESNKTFVWLEREVPYSGFQNYEKYEKTPGLVIEKNVKRYYPLGEITGQLLGFTNIDNRGVCGLENGLEGLLCGTPGWIMVQKDGWGRLHYRPDLPSKNSIDGNDIVLTIDQEYQTILYEELLQAYTETKAEKAMGIVINPNDGSILAMVNLPPFNSNEPSKYPVSVQRNAVVSDIFEPGSIFKIVTATAALDNKVLQPNHKIDCNPGYVQVGNRIIRDHDKYSILTFAEVIKNSSNVGTIKVAQLTGKDRIFNYARKFGFGAKTDIQFPGEESGILHPFKKWTDLVLAQVAIGQGVCVTALQTGMAYAAIANGGLLLKPQIVKTIKTKDGIEIFNAQPVYIRRVASSETMNTLRELLRLTVISGTGTRADINGLAIAGKTGTAQKVVNGVYSQTEYMASFVGFFPADNPKLLCVVVIDNPKGIRHTGGGVSAPVVREVFKRIVNQSDDLFFDEPAPLPTPPANYAYETQPAVADIPQTSDDTYHPNLTTAIYTNQMPDLCGKTLRQAVGILHEIGIDDIEIDGAGVVVAQKPAPHSPINPHAKCTLKLQPIRTPLE
ncbi:MAG TPA: penicillin-binding protein [Candidatus Marinimicrobia bacterium]|nr:penicillin-binding protein [Candidatus Neomarinimicrobiota bacterium]HRS51693.1 penicillin-binding protein [Candidatus Neomarinimicrobiota bacterium]HRU92157.1 penicillin-binding protein [Candidatus Neomarinimicrobiota bacterium]